LPLDKLQFLEHTHKYKKIAFRRPDAVSSSAETRVENSIKEEKTPYVIKKTSFHSILLPSPRPLSDAVDQDPGFSMYDLLEVPIMHVRVVQAV
jgi:hypothetical protein